MNSAPLRFFSCQAPESTIRDYLWPEENQAGGAELLPRPPCLPQIGQAYWRRSRCYSMLPDNQAEIAGPLTRRSCSPASVRPDKILAKALKSYREMSILK